MTVAEKMAMDNIGLVIQGGHKRLARLLRTVAKRGREEACKAMRERKFTVESNHEAIETICANKWEEEEA